MSKSSYYGCKLKQKKGCRIPWTVICPYSAQSVGDVVPRQGRDRSVGMVYLALFSEVFFKDGQVYFNNRCYTCKRGEYIGLRENLAKSCEMSLTTLDRNLVWLKERELIGMKRLNGGVCISLCGYDSIMGIRRKEAGKDAPEQSAFLALEEAERRMGGRSMQFDCCTADGEGGLQ